MRKFRGHNPKKGMVHPRKSQHSRTKLVISDSDVITDKDYSMEEDPSKQLVLYDPQTTHGQQREVQLDEPIYHSTPLQQRPPKRRYGHARAVPSFDAYTVQCSQCFKWRVVPTKEKYEELRETICDDEPFVCARAREWNRVLSCNDPEDMAQDESMLWAIDKPNIAQTPPGWDREVRIRGEGCSKFADVYYTSPAGRKLRSMVEIERYLAENPYYVRQGVYLGQFSFATPKPLQEGYIRKRKYSAATRELPEILEPIDVNPLGWAPPPTRNELLQMGAAASNPIDLDDEHVLL